MLATKDFEDPMRKNIIGCSNGMVRLLFKIFGFNLVEMISSL